MGRKITDLSLSTKPNVNDIINIVTDVLTIPINKKITIQDLMKLPVLTAVEAEAISNAELGQVICVSNGNAGQLCLALHDGTNFKVISLGTTISST